jgi:hypothetical protein
LQPSRLSTTQFSALTSICYNHNPEKNEICQIDMPFLCRRAAAAFFLSKMIKKCKFIAPEQAKKYGHTSGRLILI